MCDCIGNVGTASCCSLADTLAVGNTTGGADIELTGGSAFVVNAPEEFLFEKTGGGPNTIRQIVAAGQQTKIAMQAVSGSARIEVPIVGVGVNGSPLSIEGGATQGSGLGLNAANLYLGAGLLTNGGDAVLTAGASYEAGLPGGAVSILGGTSDVPAAGGIEIWSNPDPVGNAPTTFKAGPITQLVLDGSADFSAAALGDSLVKGVSGAVWTPKRNVNFTARASLSAATVVGANTPMFIYAGNLQTTTPTVDGFIHALQAQALYNSLAQIVAPTQISFEILKNGLAWIALPNVVPGTPEVWSLGTKYTFVAGDVLAPIVIVRNAALTGTLIAQMQISLEF